jgi:hypothetical protein
MTFIICKRKDCEFHEYFVHKKGDCCRSYLIDYLSVQVNKDGTLTCAAYKKGKNKR